MGYASIVIYYRRKLIMNIKPNLLLSIALIFSTLITESTFAGDAELLNKAFISAVSSYNLKEMQELIKAGADVNAPISHTFTSGDCDWEIKSSPLIFAIKNNQPEMVKILLQVKNKLHTTLNEALEEAIREGCSAIVEELIKEGADVNYVNKNKDTPLILAIEKARPLSEFCRQAQEQSKSRWEEREEIIQILLEAGANINYVDKYGETALMKAIKKQDLNTVQDLLKFPEITRGSFFGFGEKPINRANKDGNTALIIAIKHIRTSYIVGDSRSHHECLNSQSILEALLKTPGIDLYHVNKKGETAITLLEKLKGYNETRN